MEKNQKKVSDIKKEIESACGADLITVCSQYEMDERKSVRQLITRAYASLEKEKRELERVEALVNFEKNIAGNCIFCGIDEAGRGPLAGPVVAAAVIMPPSSRILYVNDSKQVSEKKREELYEVIKKEAAAVGVGIVSPQEIDRINILQATYAAMRQAIEQLSPVPEAMIIDAVKIPGVNIKQYSVIKGDAKCYSIAAASIIAKVTRDRIMRQYDEIYPGYGFAENKGYGSQKHIEKLQADGPVAIHRKTFIKSFCSIENN